MKRIILFLPLIMLIAACGDRFDSDCITSSARQQDEVSISFSIDGVSNTREDNANIDESAIESINLLFFNDSGILVASTGAELKNGSQDLLSFKIPAVLHQNTPYRLSAIANADYFLPEGYSDFKTYIDALHSNAQENNLSPLLHKDEALTPNSISVLPMKADAVFAYTRNKGECHTETTLSFRKLVSRIDIINETSGNLRIVAAAICNWRDAVNAAYPDETCGEVCGKYADESAGMPDFIDFREGSTSLTRSLYCFPSSPAISEPGDQQTTSVLLKAFFQDDTEATYYRVNIGEKGTEV